jgi:hypothetical protein
LAPGCGSDPADTDEEQIAAVLNKLFAAQRDGDAELACSELYVVKEPWEAAAGNEAGGEPEGEAGGGKPETEGEGSEAEGETAPGECERAFTAAAATASEQTDDLTTEIGEIEVDGNLARAIVHTELTRSDGSELSQDAPYDLVRTPDGWRIRISEEG